MKHCWVCCEAKPKAVLKEQRAVPGEDDVYIYGAGVILHAVPLEILTSRLLDAPPAKLSLRYVSTRTAYVFSEVAGHLSLGFEVHERSYQITISDPYIEGDFRSFNYLLKYKLWTTFGKTENVFPQFLVSFREV